MPKTRIGRIRKAAEAVGSVSERRFRCMRHKSKRPQDPAAYECHGRLKAHLVFAVQIPVMGFKRIQANFINCRTAYSRVFSFPVAGLKGEIY